MTRLSRFCFAVCAVLFAQAAPALAGGARYTGPAVFHGAGAVAPSATKYFTVNLQPDTTKVEAERVVAYFRTFGLHVTVTPEDDIVFVRGTYAQAGAAAHTGFTRVRVNDQVFTHATTPESFPPAIAAHILATTIEEGPSAIAASKTAVAPPGGYSPSDIATYYDIAPLYKAGLSGAGTKVAILACATTRAEDISAFESKYGLPPNQPTIVNVDGGGTVSNNLEPTGDVERVVGTAPNANITLYTVPNSCSYGQLADGFARIAADTATQHYAAVTHSYGATEDDYVFYKGENQKKAEHADLALLLQRQTPVFTVTGDWGASFDSSSQALYDGEITVWYPSSDNNVIAVGGTDALSVSANNPKRLAELGWGDGGGGVSADYPIPAWQKNVAGIASATKRNLPDVALASSAETAYAAVWTSGGQQGNYFFYGTSFAAPTWAGLTALVAEARAGAKKKPLKNLAKSLYVVASSPGALVDIISGCNGYYCAKAGYDNLTGLGSFDGAALESALLSQP